MQQASAERQKAIEQTLEQQYKHKTTTRYLDTHVMGEFKKKHWNKSKNTTRQNEFLFARLINWYVHDVVLFVLVSLADENVCPSCREMQMEQYVLSCNLVGA